jgi:uncharacterized protein YecT (DUF1311 family)
MTWRGLLAAAAILAQRVPATAQHMNEPSAPCRNEAVTADAYDCFASATKAADVRLDDYLAHINRALVPSEVAALERSQSLWMQYREADCSAERGLYGSGTGGPVAYQACLEALDRGRLIDLEASYGWRLSK